MAKRNNDRLHCGQRAHPGLLKYRAARATGKRKAEQAKVVVEARAAMQAGDGIPDSLVLAIWKSNQARLAAEARKAEKAS